MTRPQFPELENLLDSNRQWAAAVNQKEPEFFPVSAKAQVRAEANTQSLALSSFPLSLWSCCRTLILHQLIHRWPVLPRLSSVLRLLIEARADA